MDVSIITSSFLVYSSECDTVDGSWKHKQQIYFRLVVVFYALYTVQLSDKYENILKEMNWNYAYLILGLEDQYMGN